MIDPSRARTSSPPSELLAEVAALSRHFGRDPAFTRGGGGNSSGKADGVLYIKPSGVSLATLTPRSLMPLAMEPLLAVLAGLDVDAGASLPGSEAVLRIGMAARLDPADHRRPSVELIFHALLPERIVIHTHPTIVNALTCATRGQELATEILGDGALWIPYTTPGLPLARRIADEREAHVMRTGHAAPPVLLLQNHGLIVAGAGPQEIIERSSAVVSAIRGLIEASDVPAAADRTPTPGADATGPLVRAIAAAIADEVGRDGQPSVVVPDMSAPALRLATTEAGRSFVHGGPLTPDQIVYAGSWPLLVANAPSDRGRADDRVAGSVRDRLREHIAANHEPPAIIVVEAVGVFAVAASAGSAGTVRDTYLDAIRVAEGAARLGGVRPLAPEDRRFIEAWEAEAYRRGVAAAGDAGAGDGSAGAPPG
ncbi:MAG: class II aldolase/adducin family protein [Candidatus Limnocylindrales bacterium]